MLSHRRALLASLAAVLLLGGGLCQELPTGAQRLAPERYRDVPQNHWAMDAIRRLSALGVLTGYPDQHFRGGQFATRYELAVVAARLVDLIGGSLAELALDPSFWADVEDAAEMLGRMRRAERALENAASVARVEALEQRVADLEAYLNELLGEERFPLDPAATESAPASAADTVPVQPLQTESRRVPAAAPGGADRAARPGETAVGKRRPVHWWVGVAAGYPLPATVHVGLRDLLPSLHLRAGAGFSVGAGFGLELLALYRFPTAVDAPMLPYLAGGPMLRGGSAATKPGLLALAGVEIPLARDLSAPGLLYLEVGPEVVFEQGPGMGIVARTGLGYRF
jgi:hypothetical protein